MTDYSKLRNCAIRLTAMLSPVFLSGCFLSQKDLSTGVAAVQLEGWGSSGFVSDDSDAYSYERLGDEYVVRFPCSEKEKELGERCTIFGRVRFTQDPDVGLIGRFQLEDAIIPGHRFAYYHATWDQARSELSIGDACRDFTLGELSSLGLDERGSGDGEHYCLLTRENLLAVLKASLGKPPQHYETLKVKRTN